jgi:hypothetical protein
MIFGEYDQLKDIINKGKGEILNPEFGSKPRVYYIGLPKRFVAGTVLCQKIGEPLENAKVTLSNLSTRESITTKVDNYGDFEYEGLEIGAKFSVLIEKAGYQTKLMEPVHTEKDVYLGEIFLLPKE